MRRWFASSAALLLLALALPPSAGALEQYQNGYPVADVRSWGAKCDGSSDDLAAFQAAADNAYDVLGGNELVVPPGGCHLSADFVIDGYVKIKCLQGAEIVARTGGSFTNGLISFVASEFASIEGCRLNMNGFAKPAISSTSGGHQLAIRDNWIFGGANTAGANHAMVTVTSLTGPSWIEGNEVYCAEHANATGDSGIVFGGTNARGYIGANYVKGCDGIGIDVSSGSTDLVANIVDMPTSTADTDAAGIVVSGTPNLAANYVFGVAQSAGVGIKVVGNHGRAVGNYVGVTGSSALGYWVTGNFAILGENTAHINVTGGQTAKGYFIEGTNAQMNGNTGYFAGAGGYGVWIKGQAAQVNGYTGIVPTSPADLTDQQTHIVVAGPGQTYIDGANLQGGQYGIRPPHGSDATEFASSSGQPINARISDANIFSVCGASSACDTANRDSCGIQITTGMHIFSPTINWQGPDACGIRNGSNQTYGTPGSSHSIIADAHLYCTDCPALIQQTTVANRCLHNADIPFKSCSVDGDCQTGGSCDGGNNCTCTAAGGNMLEISGGQMLAVDDTGNFIDLGEAGGSPVISDVFINGVQFADVDANQDCIAFQSGGAYTNVTLGVNQTKGTCTRYKNWSDSWGTNWQNLIGASPASIATQVKTSGQTVNSTTIADVASLSTTVAAGTYIVDMVLLLDEISGANQADIQITCSSCTVTSSSFGGTGIQLGGTHVIGMATFAAGAETLFASASGARDYMIRVQGVIVTSVGGTLKPQIALNTGTGSFTVMAGSGWTVRVPS